VIILASQILVSYYVVEVLRNLHKRKFPSPDGIVPMLVEIVEAPMQIGDSRFSRENAVSSTKGARAESSGLHKDR